MDNSLDFHPHAHEARPVRTVSQFMSMVFMIMASCMLITLGVAYGVSSHPAWVYKILSSSHMVFGLFLAQLACVVFFRTVSRKVGVIGASVLLVVYSALTGLTLSSIFLLYTAASIVQTLAVTVCAFAALSVYGYVTKRELSALGSFCMMGLFGLIILGLASIFIPAMQTSGVQLALSAAAILVFSGFTAYDIKMIKSLYSPAASSKQQMHLAMMGALNLYLDFINLFLNLLDFIGKES